MKISKTICKDTFLNDDCRMCGGQLDLLKAIKSALLKLDIKFTWEAVPDGFGGEGVEVVVENILERNDPC